MKRFDSLFKVGAFVENYRNFGSMFAENLSEFEDSRYVNSFGSASISF
jgi:hypothetical protein